MGSTRICSAGSRVHVGDAADAAGGEQLPLIAVPAVQEARRARESWVTNRRRTADSDH